MKRNDFRRFVINTYWAYRDEREAYHQADTIVSLEQYFRQNKWFLRTLYRSAQ